MDAGMDPRQIFMFVFSISYSHTSFLQVWMLDTQATVLTVHAWNPPPANPRGVPTWLQAADTPAPLPGQHQACSQGDLPVPPSHLLSSQFWALGTPPLLPILWYQALPRQGRCCCASAGLWALVWLCHPNSRGRKLELSALGTAKYSWGCEAVMCHCHPWQALCKARVTTGRRAVTLKTPDTAGRSGWKLHLAVLLPQKCRAPSGCYITWPLPISEFYISLNSPLNSSLRQRWDWIIKLALTRKTCTTKSKSVVHNTNDLCPPSPLRKVVISQGKQRQAFNIPHQLSEWFSLRVCEKVSFLWFEITWQKFLSRHSDTWKNSFFLLFPVFLIKEIHWLLMPWYI